MVTLLGIKKHRMFVQLFALSKQKIIYAPEAEKRKDYICPECQAIVRLKSGKKRQSHFFHYRSNPFCKQHQKSLTHLRLQSFIHSLLQDEEAQMEYAFPEIGRIADVACLKTKKIFEIQYSPISAVEAKNRCRDYESLGFQIIWILHEHSFNRKIVTSSELFLRSKLTYYSDMNGLGGGVIYDQDEHFSGFRRIAKGQKLRVNLRATWKSSKVPLYHEGDLIYHRLRGNLPKKSTKASFNLLKTLKQKYSKMLYLILKSISD